MEFVDHPQDIPLQIKEVNDRMFPETSFDRVGFVGITWQSKRAYAMGQAVQITLKEIDPNFCVTGRVVWCDNQQDSFKIAIEFPEKEDCFCVRMIEQLSQIEHYRRQAKTQGRRLNYNEAAAEWINKFAASFPAFTI
ncbi:energy transducer TonB [Marinomonas sp. 15G1-11]|uniref:Energy transducer TonB n=1 Tax=Marinomonas phaeophyticola TaxID=3004091 RepID=A0ABT4JUX7_9GAMM|nr:energy transducer TonB [Marinomonas sp. 15G1-11]MCZ2722150.1 energy transducer TonB [Marinomonas sp. 15G1-11]